MKINVLTIVQILHYISISLLLQYCFKYLMVFQAHKFEYFFMSIPIIKYILTIA